MEENARDRRQVFTSPLSDGEKLVRDIMAELREAGIKAFVPKFPYALHHEHYRTRLRIGGKHLRHATVAERLGAWAADRVNPDDYVNQAVCGALLRMFSDDPRARDRLPAAVESRLERIDWGEDFGSWLLANPPPQV